MNAKSFHFACGKPCHHLQGTNFPWGCSETTRKIKEIAVGTRPHIKILQTLLLDYLHNRCLRDCYRQKPVSSVHWQGSSGHSIWSALLSGMKTVVGVVKPKSFILEKDMYQRHMTVFQMVAGFLKHARDYPLALLGHHEEGIKGSFHSPDQLHPIMKKQTH
ncbi:hypothetical protein MUK42_33033 [Musa troglodytarum]|uniref:Uncharacterized protein n=1 Tax=Musa troglodytarum TaxID=320322 RepID=A0A9E7L7X0_9LILI|nr:hypothetical protein MUK42_33033 [Musa troglodytarum]